MARLVTRSTRCSTRTARTPVSSNPEKASVHHTDMLPDVIILTAMGEEACIDAKEAPK
ncbi:hypothetical protein IG631_13809 [Alternaria alternata]|nr:hypothetical protein IG631_13809 [Alternaria alternata]